MKLRKFATISLLVLSSFAANNVAPSKAELESMYDRAFREFNANNYAEALQQLDAIDARQPDLAESQNLRGVIMMREGKYDEAEKALQKALASDPKFWNAKFNLAEIPFLQKNWTEARNRFQSLLFGNDLQLQGEALQLIQYKILLTYLLEGKENMVDAVMAKLELAPDTPALHYANAAIAFQHKNDTEANDWLDKAQKNFSPQLNKLFAESIYEVGWMKKPVGTERPSVELTSAADRAAKAKQFARSKFEEAEQAFQQRDLTAARKDIEEAEKADPNQAPYVNLRGEILLAQKDFEAADGAFREALKIDSKYREAQYNLAQVPFKKKEYAKARERFEQLFNSTPAPGNDKDQAAQLIKFKIYLTLLLEGKDARAQKMMEQFQFTGDTPALYYAQAAWEFKHSNAAKANDWITSARKIYSPAMNIVFADAFYDLGWIQNVTPPATQGTAELAKEEATPNVEPTPIRGAALAANTAGKSSPATTQKSNESPVPGMEATTQRSPATQVAQSSPPVRLAQNNVAPSPAASLSPSVETPVAANASPADARAATLPQESQAPVAASQAPQVAQQNQTEAAQPSIANAPAVAANPTGAQIAATNASATPMTALAPAKVREWSQPSALEALQRYVDPRALLVGALLLAGIIILLYLVISTMRRRAVMAPTFRPAPAPVGPPKFASIATSSLEERVVARTPVIAGGPRQISLQLRASEPSVRRSAVPFSQAKRPFGFAAPAPVATATVIEAPEVEAPREIEPVIEAPEAFHEPSHTESPSDSPGANGAVEANGATDMAAPVSRAAALVPEPADAPATSLVDDFAPPPTTETAAVEAPPFAPEAAESARVLEAEVAVEPEFSAPAELERIAQPVEANASVAEAAPEVQPEAAPDVASMAEAVRSEIMAPEFGSTTPIEGPRSSADEVGRRSAEVSDVQPEAIAPVEFATAEESIPQIVPAPASAEPAFEEAQAEPIGQGQPVPHLIPAALAENSSVAEEGATSEPASPRPQQSRFARLVAAGAALAGIGSLRRLSQPQQQADASARTAEAEPQPEPVFQTETVAQQELISVSTSTEPGPAPLAEGELAPLAATTFSGEPNFTKPNATEPLIDQTSIMAAPTQTTPAPTIRTATPTGAPAPQGQTQATGGMQTAVQLTFAFEIAALQLTPTFKMGAMQLRPTSRVVSMRLAASQQPQPAMNLQVTFEIANVQPTGGAIGTVRLTPSQQQRPNVGGSPAFTIAGLQLLGGQENAALQLTPAGHQAAVQVTGRFQIATVEFSPSFEIAALVLNSASRQVNVQLPGANQMPVESSPVFEIANVQVAGNGEIAMLQLSAPGGAAAAPRPQ